MAKKRFNFIDVIIVAVVVAAVAAVCFMYSSKTSKNDSGDKNLLRFTVEVTDVEDNYINSVKVGDRVIFGTSSSDEAVVVGFEKTEAEKLEKDVETGKFVLVKSDKRYDALVTLEGKAVKTADDIKIGSTAVKTGDSFEGKAKGSGNEAKAYLINGYVLDMTFGE